MNFIRGFLFGTAIGSYVVAIVYSDSETMIASGVFAIAAALLNKGGK